MQEESIPYGQKMSLKNAANHLVRAIYLYILFLINLLLRRQLAPWLGPFGPFSSFHVLEESAPEPSPSFIFINGRPFTVPQ
jgi:hypothetical protein